ncbi:MAG: hypothetical protein JYX80_07245 [Candidatus Scalindua sediminis]|nr:hypothetical protein [Candidatus Scalindua sediminis]
MNNDEVKQHKSPWKIIVSTIIACATVFGFIYTYTINIKNARIDLMEEQIKTLKDFGAVPDALRNLENKIISLEEKIIPLSVATKVDPITGRCQFGAMDSPTDLSQNFSEALVLIKDKKFDIALAKADEMGKLLPSFLGSTYIRFLVNKEKKFDDEAAKYARLILQKIPGDNRTQDVYVFIIKYDLSKGRKKAAEDHALAALKLWPEDQKLNESFKAIFGYTPSN